MKRIEGLIGCRIGRLLPLLVTLVGTACGGERTSPPELMEERRATASSGAPDRALVPTIQYRRDQIQLVSEGPFTDTSTGQSYHRAFYRNLAYRCGRTGYYTFAVLTPTALAGKKAPLWVALHGGGTGYYGTDGRYHPGGYDGSGAWVASNEAQNDEYNLTQLTRAGLKLGRPGTRLLALHMCDHDLYAGVGSVYPNNPNPGRANDRVEGMLASMSAVHFTARGNGLTGPGHLDGYPTGLVFFQGSSAGSAGAYFVSAGFSRLGIRINGAILDSYTVTTRHPELFDAGCTPLNQDPSFSMEHINEKIGVWVSDPTLLLENNVPGLHALPYIMLEGSEDRHCCGDVPPIPSARAAGFTNNCKYVFDTVTSAFASASSPLYRTLIIEGAGHVVGNLPEARAAVDNWLSAVMAAGPVPPTFPD